MKTWLTTLFAVGVQLAISTSLAAASYCSEPSPPYCAQSYGSFEDEYDFENCKREMESYRDDVESYSSCLADEARELVRKRDEAMSEFNDTVESFNRRARGD